MSPAEETGPIIGGVFGLELRSSAGRPPDFLKGRNVFPVNARSAIWLLLKAVRPPRVWVPSYICHTVVSAVHSGPAELRFYEVGIDLKVQSAECLAGVQPGDLVIFVDYFGFPHDRRLAGSVKEKGAWVLEDACQALLSGHVGGASDFVVFSPRKWIGVPDGAILRVPDGFPDAALGPAEPQWWLKAFRASVLRLEFDGGKPGREWFRLFREAEDGAPTGAFAMSPLSRLLMEHSVDYPGAAARRVENYQALLNRLGDHALFPSLDPGTVPLGFPVRLARRDTVREALFASRIYPPVHWPIGGFIPPAYAESHRLSAQILTLPCDQRYGPEEMERMAGVVLESL